MRKLFLMLIVLLPLKTLAQGDGARMLLWGPKGATGLIPKWMHMEQNILPSELLVKSADVTINAFPVTVIHNFSLAGRFAQIMINGVPGNVSGRLAPNLPNDPQPELNANGFADGFVGFKLGLVNQPALNVKEFAGHQHKVFSMMGYFRVWYPGSYDHSKPINMGSNRVTFELGFPVNFFLSKNLKRPMWLESYPAIHLYTPNNDPTVITRADKTQQRPLFSWENHLSKNLTDKFWASIDARYQYGGAILADGENQDNTINFLGGGLTAGYQIIPPLGINASWATRWATGSDVNFSMVKVTAVFTYVNLKKIK